MKPKELLCVALIAENGKRYDTDVYTDGTFLNQEGEYQKLTPLQFETLKVLMRRADREKMLILAANDVIPYREGDKEPEPYTESIEPFTEDDFLLPEERELPADMVTADRKLPEIPGLPKIAEKKPDTVLAPESGNPEATQNKAGESEDGQTEIKPEEVQKPAAKPKKKKRLPVVLIIVVLLLLLCAAGFGIGYMNGYFDMNMLPGVVMEELGEITGNKSEPAPQPAVTPVPTPEQLPTPTPTPVPPKTEINLTINAMDGAEVSGSTDVGVNEDGTPDIGQDEAETDSANAEETN